MIIIGIACELNYLFKLFFENFAPEINREIYLSIDLLFSKEENFPRKNYKNLYFTIINYRYEDNPREGVC